MITLTAKSTSAVKNLLNSGKSWTPDDVKTLEKLDILKRREDWFDGQLDLDPQRLVFIDETWTSTNMARRYGRAPKGERLRAGVPHGHWKTTTFIGALSSPLLVMSRIKPNPL